MFVAEAGTGGLAALDETAVQDAFRARRGQDAIFDILYAEQMRDPATGQMVTQPGVIYNKRTGQLAPQTQTAAKPAQNFEAGKVYTDAKGNRARWDGKQFVPA